MQTPLASILASIESEHARALEWFARHEGDVGSRPWRVQGRSVIPGIGIPVVAQRGIHQPSGWDLALSITATTGSAYLDGKPVRVDDETWVLPYRAHEGGDGWGLDSRWNRSLAGNLRRRIPVGVFVPSGRQYLNLGLAMVESFDAQTGTFLLRGPLRYEQAAGTWLDPNGSGANPPDWVAAEDEDDERVLASVKRRHAQQQFRSGLLSAYDERCAITGCDAPDALQGAHILSYSGRSSQLTANGLLLRADLHLLYDRHLLSVDPEDRRVWLAPQLKTSSYARLDGKKIARPARVSNLPAPEKLAVHWAVFERAIA